MKTNRSNLGINAMAALALFGAVLSIVVLVFAFSAEGARIADFDDIANLTLRLDASEQCRGVADGTAQSSWTDLSGNGNNGVQATGSRQPTCQTAAGDLVNGRPILDHDGGDGFVSAFTSIGTTSTVFMAVDIDTSGDANGVCGAANTFTFFDGDDGTDRQILACSSGEFDLLLPTLGPGTGAEPKQDVMHVLSVVFNGASSAYYIDGVVVASGAGGANALSGMTVGCSNGFASSCINGQLGEVLVYADALSDNNRRAVEGLLAKKWTGGALPVPSFFISGKLPARQVPGNCTGSNVALWEDFEESSGNLTVPTGCGAAGTTLTATSITYEQQGPPGLGRAALFNATNDKFTSTSDVAALDVTTSLVVEGWFRYQGNTPEAGVASVAATVNKQDGSNVGWNLELAIDGVNDPAFSVGDADTDSCTVHWGSDPFADLQWHRIRAVWNGTTCTIAVDGATAVSNTIEVNGDGVITTLNNTDPFEITTTDVTGTASLYVADLRVTIGNTTNDLGFNAGAHSGTGGATLAAPTFTRATASTRINPVTGRVESVASGLPAVGSPLSSGDDGSIDGTEPTGVYVGSATTFRVLQNEDASAAVWAVNDLTVTVNQATAPDGQTTADLLEPSTNGMLRQTTSGMSGACGSATSCTATTWLRSATGGNVSLTFYVLGGSGTPICTQAITVTTTWQRFVCTNTGAEGLNPFFRLGTGTTNDWTTGENVYIWRPQMYQKGFAVPLDPAVAASAVTINRDTPSWSVVSTGLSTAEYTVALWTHAPTNGTNYTAVQLNRVSGQDAYLMANRSGVVSIRDASIFCQTTFGSPGAVNAWHHYAFSSSESANVSRAFLNGVQSGSASTPCPTIAQGLGAVASIDMDGTEVLFDAPHFAADVRVYKQLLSPQQIRALYLARSAVYAQRPPFQWEPRRRTMLATAAPLESVWEILTEKYWYDQRVEAARRYVASPDFPQPVLEVQPP